MKRKLIRFALIAATLLCPMMAVAETPTAAAKPPAKLQTPTAAPLPEIVGKDRIYTARAGDTFASVGEAFNVGFVALRAANPDIMPWELSAGDEMILPGSAIVPTKAPRNGIVINVGEMRLYDYTQSAAEPKIYPIGVGREGLTTPPGTYKIGAKLTNPTWRPTERMRAEDPKLPEAVPPGPENPLGKHSMILDGTLYRIHGTNKPWGVGRRASSGCIRMYPANIEEVFKRIPSGTKVTIISEPIKIAVKDGAVFLEAHPDEAMADAYENDYARNFTVPNGSIKMISEKAGDLRSKIDWAKVRDVLAKRPGFPVKITG
jgi:L,D-transpeptidase ErfK/SrfK